MTEPEQPEASSGLVIMRPLPGEPREELTRRFHDALRRAGAPVPAEDDDITRDSSD